jgi:hypothetical protein
VRFYRIDWPVSGQADDCSDWSTSWDQAHRIGRAQSDYYKVSVVELPEKKAEMLAFLREHIRRQPRSIGYESATAVATGSLAGR